MLGRQEAAEAHFRSAIAIRAELADVRGELASRLNLAGLYGDSGRPADALEQLSAVVTGAQAAGVDVLVPPALNNIAENELRPGRADASARAALRAATAAVTAGDLRSQAFAHYYLAEAYTASGRSADADADAQYRTAVDLAHDSGDKHADASALTSYGDMLSGSGRFDEARVQWRRAESLYRTLDPGSAAHLRPADPGSRRALTRTGQPKAGVPSHAGPAGGASSRWTMPSISPYGRSSAW